MSENEEFMEFDDDENEELRIITMVDDEGDELEFFVINELVDNGVSYLLLIESEFADDEESDAIIFKMTSNDNDQPVYEEIEDDEEFERIAGLFAKDSDEYDLEV